ncbi:hypothetical protein E2562_013098 [Oryza meyeriana var. granulata]|uniref:Uncharacterized protein n=1 Tax=Oryza meyeriana var. granulata TaxID=110450 RepID=A0A6G1F7I8_9ORYZ|nr:hypothetical protein E2562_013098 [Oryza meyeriana var. granulata]
MAEMDAGGEETGPPGQLVGTEEHVRRFHRHEPGGGQCSSAVAMRIKAPVHLVWSLVRRFDEPHIFQPFVRGCMMRGSSVAVGCVREVDFKSGFPAKTSAERLEILDDKEHIFSIRIIGGDHRLKNYLSVLTANSEVIDGQPATLVFESFVVDVPEGNTADETRQFVEFLIRCNLRSLAVVSQRLLAQGDVVGRPAQ